MHSFTTQEPETKKEEGLRKAETAGEGAPIMAQQKRTRLASMRMRVRSLASLSGLRIRHCPELWCRAQMQLGSAVTMASAWAGGYNSNLTPNLGTSVGHMCGPKKPKINKKERKEGRKKLQVEGVSCPSWSFLQGPKFSLTSKKIILA